MDLALGPTTLSHDHRDMRKHADDVAEALITIKKIAPTQGRQGDNTPSHSSTLAVHKNFPINLNQASAS